MHNAGSRKLARGYFRVYSLAGSAASSCASRLIAQEILLFCFQQDLDSALMHALNTENTERAQEIRERLQLIDEAVQEIQASKKSGGGNDISQNVQCTLSENVHLRASLQEAIMQENYVEAAKLRDELKVLQKQQDEASSKATLISRKLDQQRKLKLGQRVLHDTLGYRAVVCGWDATCCESAEWQEEFQIQKLEGGLGQPFYQLLVDLRDCSGEEWKQAGPIAYVAQEHLTVPDPQSSWIEEHGEERLHNPFVLNLFLGYDERGDLIPARVLREKYSQQRQDVQPPQSVLDEQSKGSPGTKDDDGKPPDGNDGFSF